MNESVITHKQVNNINVIKPISNINDISNGQKNEYCVKVPKYNISERVKCEYVNFINTVYKPTHFLTVRLPKHWETTNLNHAIGRLRLIMKVFERNLIRNHWNRHHLPFIATSETGDGIYWHFHILFNQDKYTNEMLQNAIRETIKSIRGMSEYCLELDKIGDKVIDDKLQTFMEALHNTDFYCLKEIQVNRYGKFDGDRIIFSDDLFNLPYQDISH